LGIDKADHAKVWARLLKPIRVAAGESVCTRGERTSSLYLVHSGQLVVSLNAGDRHQVVVELKAGSFFGELGLLHPASANADVVASEDCELFELDEAAFATMNAEHPVVARGLMHHANEILARRVMGIESLEDVPQEAQEAQQSLLGRLAGLFFGHKGDSQ
jgi:CRP-like cAMP-binding protein